MQGNPRRIGLLGGAFDPPHLAHVALAQAALQQLQLDELRVLPTGFAAHKARPLTAAVQRLAMTRLAFSDTPRTVVDEREMLRAGPSYTVDTLRELHAEQPAAQFFLLIGQDQARAFHTWREFDEITRLAIICVAYRDDSTRAATPFESTPPVPANFLTLALPAINISSTEIRRRVAAGQTTSALANEAVARYIAHHHLYQTP